MPHLQQALFITRNSFSTQKFKEMSLSSEQYKDILTIAMDHQLTHLRGGIVFDDFDPAVEGDKVSRACLHRLIKQKQFDKLEKMLQEFIQRFQYNDQYDFASVLLQKIGYRIEPIPKAQISLSTYRNLRVGMSGKGVNALTFVSIELPAGSGSIYCVKGTHPELKADWLNEHTIQVQIPAIREEVKRITQVKTYGETITIVYNKQ
jgi:hypothetical protein